MLGGSCSTKKSRPCDPSIATRCRSGRAQNEKREVARSSFVVLGLPTICMHSCSICWRVSALQVHDFDDLQFSKGDETRETKHWGERVWSGFWHAGRNSGDCSWEISRDNERMEVGDGAEDVRIFDKFEKTGSPQTWFSKNEIFGEEEERRVFERSYNWDNNKY